MALVGSGDRPALVAGVESGDERAEPVPEPTVEADAYEDVGERTAGRLGSSEVAVGVQVGSDGECIN